MDNFDVVFGLVLFRRAVSVVTITPIAVFGMRPPRRLRPAGVGNAGVDECPDCVGSPSHGAGTEVHWRGELSLLDLGVYGASAKAHAVHDFGQA